MKKLSLSKLSLIFMFIVVIFTTLSCSKMSDERIEDKKVLPKKEAEKLNESKEEVKTENIDLKEVEQEEVVISKEDKELQKIKILKVGKYEIDTTKHKPNENITVKYKTKVINNLEYGSVEYLLYSPDKKYVLFVKGEWSENLKGESSDDLGDWNLNLYSYQGKMTLIKKIDIGNGQKPDNIRFLLSGNLIMETREFASSADLEIYNLKGEKIFEISLEDRYYRIPPNEEYVIIINKRNYIIEKYVFEQNKTSLNYKLKDGGKIYLIFRMFSSDGKYFIIQQDFKKESILYFFSENKLLWEHTYSCNDFNIEEFSYFMFTNNSKYIMQGYSIIDIKTGNIIKKNLSKEELKKYQEEK